MHIIYNVIYETFRTFERYLCYIIVDIGRTSLLSRFIEFGQR